MATVQKGKETHDRNSVIRENTAVGLVRAAFTFAGESGAIEYATRG